MFIRIWQYRAREDKLAEFRAEYGTSGAWVSLFRGANGYVATELVQSVADPLEFVTIDRWTSREAWESFLGANERAYRALDEACAQLTAEERALGSFETVDGGGRSVR